MVYRDPSPLDLSYVCVSRSVNPAAVPVAELAALGRMTCEFVSDSRLVFNTSKYSYGLRSFREPPGVTQGVDFITNPKTMISYEKLCPTSEV